MLTCFHGHLWQQHLPDDLLPAGCWNRFWQGGGHPMWPCGSPLHSLVMCKQAQWQPPPPKAGTFSPRASFQHGGSVREFAASRNPIPCSHGSCSRMCRQANTRDCPHRGQLRHTLSAPFIWQGKIMHVQRNIRGSMCLSPKTQHMNTLLRGHLLHTPMLGPCTEATFNKACEHIPGTAEM